MRIAVIPARGGSKRIPRKNIRDFCGKPIIGWSIAAARDSGCFDHVLVSTDDAEIAQVARSHGADMIIERPADLSDDHTATVPVIAHAARWCAETLAPPQAVCCLYATAPFVTGADLWQGMIRLEQSGGDYVIAATTYGFPIQRALRLAKDGRISMFSPQYDQTRSQDLEPSYHDAGQFYWGRTEAWLEGRPILGGASTSAIILPRTRVQDIDTPEDWQHAEAMFRALNQTAG